MTDDHDDFDEATQAVEKVTIRAAETWPVYNVERARAEIIAMELLTRGVSQYRVCQMTKLSSYNVRRLAKLVYEEAVNPARPRIVCRSPVPAAHPGCRRPPRPPPPEPEQMAFFD